MSFSDSEQDDDDHDGNPTATTTATIALRVAAEPPENSFLNNLSSTPPTTMNR